MIGRLTLVLASLALVSGLLAPRLASAQSREAPAPEAVYLSANCANCHGPQGRSAGAIPSLAGLPSRYVVEQMQAFKAGTRSATIMHQLAKGYTDAQFELMASYFSSLPKP
jgi:cytochrome subunit of sulfide dehydrogenase